LIQLVHRKEAILRIHLLIFFELKELAKLARISKEFHHLVDPNKFINPNNHNSEELKESK
jgi:hypothetical protein